MAGLGIAVQQDHRAARAADEVMQPNPVDFGESLGKTGRHRARRLERGRSQQQHGAKDCEADYESMSAWCWLM